ncbi:primase-helicase family protein [Vibrio astriarenae]
MELVFLQAKMPLRKQFGAEDGTDRAYPSAVRFLSVHEDIALDEPRDALTEYTRTLKKHAECGRALLKGTLTRDKNHPLNWESRRGLTDKTAKSQLLILDIDGLSMPGFTPQATPEGVEQAAEMVLQYMPSQMQTCSYVAIASSSFARKSGALSVHLHFLLHRPVEPRVIKDFLNALNYVQVDLYSRLTLTNSLLSIKSIVDPCLAEPSRLVYIAPPIFGPNAKNPFSNNKDRIVTVHKSSPTFDLDQAFTGINVDAVRKLKGDKLKELQKALGVETAKRKYTSITVKGNQMNVVANPEAVRMEFAYDDADYVRYNVISGISTGDSNAYWVFKSNPEVVHCFKPDEPPFLFREADPEAYQRHVARFGTTYEEQENEAGKMRKVRHMGFIDHHSDKYFGISHDFENDELVDIKERKRETLDQWLVDKGIEPPQNYPIAKVEMKTDTLKAMFRRNGETVVNMFRPPALLREAGEHEFVGNIGYGSAHLLQFECPIIFSVMYHMLGSDDESYEHFMNWFAFIIQNRVKSETAWLLQGTEGTGKGLFFKRIVRPILGQAHSAQKTVQLIADDNFNSWMEPVLFLMVDEFNSEGASSSVRKVENQLKNLITEPILTIRGMQRAQVERPNYLNILFGTNDHGAVHVDDGNRRYNIPPRQERKLVTLFARNFEPHELDPSDGVPDGAMNLFDRKSFDEALDAELPTFADFLNSFLVDQNQVYTVMENQAAEIAKEAAMTAAERFFNVLRVGDFAFMVDLLFKPLDKAPEAERMQLQQVKTVIKQFLPYVNTTDICPIRHDDIRIIYSYLSGKAVTQNYLGRLLTENALPEMRSTRPAGQSTNDPSRPRCTPVTWRCDEKLLGEVRSALALPQGNVVAMDSTTSSTQPIGLDALPEIPELIGSHPKK